MGRIEIQNTIKATLEAVSGVENVYTDFVRIRDMEDIITKYVTADGLALQRWLIRRIASEPHTAESHPGEVTRRWEVDWYHTFTVDLFYAYREEESEVTKQALIDAVLTAFQDKRTLGGWATIAPLGLVNPLTPGSLNNIVGEFALFSVTVADQVEGLAPS